MIQCQEKVSEALVQVTFINKLIILYLEITLILLTSIDLNHYVLHFETRPYCRKPRPQSITPLNILIMHHACFHNFAPLFVIMPSHPKTGKKRLITPSCHLLEGLENGEREGVIQLRSGLYNQFLSGV